MTDTSPTRTAALWTLAAVAATANLVTSLAHAGLAANLTTGLITLAALTTLGAATSGGGGSAPDLRRAGFQVELTASAHPGRRGPFRLT